MISETFPHNRLQELQLKRKLRPLFIFAAFIFIWALAVFLTPISYAATIDDVGSAGNDVGGFNIQAFNQSQPFTNNNPTVNYFYNGGGASLSTVILRMSRSSGTATGIMKITILDAGTSGISNPDLSTIVATSTGTYISPLNQNGATGPGADTTFTFVTPFTLVTGHYYWFLPQNVSGNQTIYLWTQDNAITSAVFRVKASGNWVSLGAGGERIKLSGTITPSPLTFTNLTGTGVTVGTTINFRVAWSSAYTGALLTGRMYPTSTGTESTSTNTVLFTPQKAAGSSAGSVDFAYTYKVGGSFRPLVQMSSCGGEGYTDSNGVFHEGSFSSTGAFIPNGACRTTYLTGATITVGGSTTDFDATIPQYFHPVTIQQAYSINTGIPFSYTINSTICTSGSITKREYFSGLPASFAQYDQSTLLSANSGSGSLFYTNTSQQMGGNPTPYIKVTCSNGGTPKVYMYDTLYSTRALSLFLFSTAQVVDPVLQTGTKGGKSTDYNGVTGSGAYFYTDKDRYDKLETVVARVYFKVTFTVGSVVVCPDPVSLSSNCVTLTASQYITNATEHLYTFSYSATGQYYPRIQVRSNAYDANNSATYRYIWLGGNTTKNPEGYLTVSDTVINSNGFQTTLGIFGLDASTFNVSFGDNQNQFLQFLSFIITYVLKAALYVASYAFWALQQAPFFDFITTSIAPASGSVWYVPTSINGIPLPHILTSGSSCTVHYASDAQGAFIFKVLQISLAGAIVGMFFRKFL